MNYFRQTPRNQYIFRSAIASIVMLGILVLLPLGIISEDQVTRPVIEDAPSGLEARIERQIARMATSFPSPIGLRNQLFALPLTRQVVDDQRCIDRNTRYFTVAFDPLVNQRDNVIQTDNSLFDLNNLERIIFQF